MPTLAVGSSLGRPGAALGAMRGRTAGFTLLELLVVISIIAIASAGVGFAMRDSAQTMLDREGERLAALLESARALSRRSGPAMRWRATDKGFRFEGLNAGKLPDSWLSPGTSARQESAAGAAPATPVLALGPEPIIEPQAVTLVQDGRSLRIATDGLHPFALQATAPGAP